MTQDEIIRMSREAGLGDWVHPNNTWYVELERFAALVAANEREKALRQEHGVPDTVSPLDFVVGSVKQAVLAEREACAKVCDEVKHRYQKADYYNREAGANECAAAIRARGE